MRIQFEEGKQRELILNEKERNSLTLGELADFLKIKEGKLNAYYFEDVLMPEDIFEKFSLKKEYEKYIVDKKEENWGQVKGGNFSSGKTKKVNLPSESEELAEFYGIMLGDGNSTKKRGYKIGTYQIRIVGDSQKDRDFLINFVKPLIEKLFNTKVFVFKQKGANALYLSVSSKIVVDFLEQKGFNPGNKIKNKLRIPGWIIKNKKYLSACIRGLFDTDGSVYKIPNQNVYQITFTNHNSFLLKDVRESLLALGIGVSQVSNGRKMYITKKSELRRFLNDVGFRNSKHLDKVRMWNI